MPGPSVTSDVKYNSNNETAAARDGQTSQNVRIAYIQYTNPAGYPPLEHSSLILARQGADIRFYGAAAHGADALKLPDHPSISVKRLPSFGPGVLLKLNYFVFVIWTIAACLLWRPSWIYASEAMAAPPSLMLAKILGCRVIFHEHDTPAYGANLGLFQRWLKAARLRISKTADICILPQEGRLQFFVRETGRTLCTMQVWNCPRRDEVVAPRTEAQAGTPMRFYYHGSLNAERLPFTVLEALAASSSTATLSIAGYETVGSAGYLDALSARARELGLETRVSYRGALVSRKSLLAAAENADVGLAFMPIGSRDINMAQMTGASNKPFDYLAVGAAVMVSDLAAWRDMYVTPGYGRACDPADVVSLTAAMRWCVENPSQIRQMGEFGRQRIEQDWNYERQFEKVALKIMSGQFVSSSISGNA